VIVIEKQRVAAHWSGDLPGEAQPSLQEKTIVVYEDLKE